MRIVYWLRRDLRLIDNPALQWACQQADSLCLLYIDDPADPPGAAARWWLSESLHALARQLKRQNQKMCLLKGDSRAQLLKLVRDTNVDAVCWNRLYEPHTRNRDSLIKQELLTAGVEAKSFNSALLFEPWEIANRQGLPYRVFSPFNKVVKPQLVDLPSINVSPQLPDCLHSTLSLPFDAFHSAANPAWTEKFSTHWHAGEEAALQRLEEFSEDRMTNYHVTRDFLAQAGTSRLSPHLHFGEISPRQILATLAADETPGADKYRDELVWREFAHHLLFHFPDTLEQPFQARFAQFQWQSAADNDEIFQRWCHGETGIELVDAAMRELWETGWMHNRARMITASFLTKNLGLNWRDGAAWFLETLVDADLANNTFGWQWAAGCGADAAPYFRIFNPDTQAEKFDPDGEYRKRWLNAERPTPLCDLKRSRERALQRYQTLKSRTS